jgi:hypothetical protein
MKDIILVMGPPPKEHSDEDYEKAQDNFHKQLREALDNALKPSEKKWEPVDLETLDMDSARGAMNPIDFLERAAGFPSILGGLVAALEREAFEYLTKEMIDGLTKENAELRTMCDEYKSMIEKLRAKVVEQDEVIGKLAIVSSTGKTSLSS